MKKIFSFSFIIFILSFLLVSCHCKKKTTSDVKATSEVKKDFEKEGYVKAIVINYEVTSCGFLIQLPDEKKLEPTPALATEFQKDQLAVWVKYIPKKGGMSACMAGQMVDISDIQLRK